MKRLQALLLQIALFGLVYGASNLLRLTFEADRDEAEAGEAVTFRVQAEFTPGYPANLVNDEVELNLIGLSGLAYNKDQAYTYVTCNLRETTVGSSKIMQIEVTEFELGRNLDCNITMRMSSSLRPGSIFRQNLFMQWKEVRTGGSEVRSEQLEANEEIMVPRLQVSMALNDALDKFYTCGPPYLGINIGLPYLGIDIVIDFPKSDLSELMVELRWPLGGTDPDVEIIRIPATDIGEVLEASGVTAGPLTAIQNPGDLTGGVFKLTNVQASGQSSNSKEDIVIETRLQVVDEFRPLVHGSKITIGATLTHPASDDGIEIELSYQSSLTFEIVGPEMDQNWECEQYVNGGGTVQCHIWVAIWVAISVCRALLGTYFKF